jgi:hypothetical protein
LKSGGNATKKRRKKKFRFEELWLRDGECKKIAETYWGLSTGVDPLSNIRSKINGTRTALLEWSKTHFGRLKAEIDTTRAQLAHFFDTSFSAIPTDGRLFLESKLNDLLHQENAFWKQRAKVFWITDGDLNTNFFHRHVSNR